MTDQRNPVGSVGAMQPGSLNYPCPRCSAARPTLEADCPQCGWKPTAIVETRASDPGPVTTHRSPVESRRRKTAIVLWACIAGSFPVGLLLILLFPESQRGAIGTLWGICVCLPLVFFGIPAAIILSVPALASVRIQPRIAWIGIVVFLVLVAISLWKSRMEAKSIMGRVQAVAVPCDRNRATT